jgi:hypothetical protein
MKIEKIEKVGKYIVMSSPDGRTAKYDLSTQKTIGIKGEPVKSLHYQLGSMSVNMFFERFVGAETYVNYLTFICQQESIGQYGAAVSMISRIYKYARLEQYFAMGVRFDSPYIPIELVVLPGYIKMLKEYDIPFNPTLAEFYAKHPNETRDMMATASKCQGFTRERFMHQLRSSASFGPEFVRATCYEHFITMGYNPTALILYLDRLITNEYISPDGIVTAVFDYANMACQISPTRWVRQPKWFLSTKNITIKNFEQFKETYNESLFAARVDTRFEMQIEDYVFLYPRTTGDVKDEAGQQSHCVASYIDRVINGSCDILFMRRADDPKKSLLTIEWRKDHVEQVRGYQNRMPWLEEQTVLNEYVNRLLNRLSYRTTPDVDYDIVLDADVMDYDVNNFDMN